MKQPQDPPVSPSHGANDATLPAPAGLRSQRPAVEIGQTVSHYRILNRLGSGGIGEVYEAEDQQDALDEALGTRVPAAAREFRDG